MTASSARWPRPAQASFDGDDIVSPRVEARDKVTGAAKYTVDIRHDGQLEGVILRSQHRARADRRTRSRAGARDSQA